MIPTGRLLALLLVPAAAAVFVWFKPDTAALWWSALAAVTLLAIADAVMARSIPTPAVSRRVPEVMGLNGPGKVGLSLTNAGSRPIDMAVFDHYPDSLDVGGLPAALRTAPEKPRRSPTVSYPGDAANSHFRAYRSDCVPPSVCGCTTV